MGTYEKGESEGWLVGAFDSVQGPNPLSYRRSLNTLLMGQAKRHAMSPLNNFCA